MDGGKRKVRKMYIFARRIYRQIRYEPVGETCKTIYGRLVEFILRPTKKLTLSCSLNTCILEYLVLRFSNVLIKYRKGVELVINNIAKNSNNNKININTHGLF